MMKNTGSTLNLLKCVTTLVKLIPISYSYLGYNRSCKYTDVRRQRMKIYLGNAAS